MKNKNEMTAAETQAAWEAEMNKTSMGRALAATVGIREACGDLRYPHTQEEIDEEEAGV